MGRNKLPKGEKRDVDHRNCVDLQQRLEDDTCSVKQMDGAKHDSVLSVGRFKECGVGWRGSHQLPASSYPGQSTLVVSGEALNFEQETLNTELITGTMKK